jgi:hypothetical protein
LAVPVAIKRSRPSSSNRSPARSRRATSSASPPR